MLEEYYKWRQEEQPSASIESLKKISGMLLRFFWPKTLAGARQTGLGFGQKDHFGLKAK